eukprot:2778392-Amphidinium_carterae.1
MGQSGTCSPPSKNIHLMLPCALGSHVCMNHDGKVNLLKPTRFDLLDARRVVVHATWGNSDPDGMQSLRGTVGISPASPALLPRG